MKREAVFENIILNMLKLLLRSSSEKNYKPKQPNKF